MYLIIKISLIAIKDVVIDIDLALIVIKGVLDYKDISLISIKDVVIDIDIAQIVIKGVLDDKIYL